MKVSQTKTIVFITGAFVTNNCWDEWIPYFESKGYKCIAPPWPYKDSTAEILRQGNSDKNIASNNLSGLTEYYANIIRQQPERPIVVGHSMGGLIVQLLLQRDLAAAGVAIHPVPPKGVISTKFSFVKAAWGPLGFFTSRHKPFMMSFKQWQYAFTNGMSLNDQQNSYQRFCTPESKMVSRNTLSKAAKIDFKKGHEPLLITSGSIDRVIPASLNKTNFKKYKNNNSITGYKEFEGRNHFVLGQPTWKEDAVYILGWLNSY